MNLNSPHEKRVSPIQSRYCQRFVLEVNIFLCSKENSFFWFNFPWLLNRMCVRCHVCSPRCCCFQSLLVTGKRPAKTTDDNHMLDAVVLYIRRFPSAFVKAAVAQPAHSSRTQRCVSSWHSSNISIYQSELLLLLFG